MKTFTLEDARALSAKATGGEWFTGHLCRDDHSCNCPYIYSDNQHGMGALATIGTSTEDVANLEEAGANQALIVFAVNYVRQQLYPDYFSEEPTQ